MSAVLGANKTKIDAGGLANLGDKGTYDAEVRCIVDSYEAAALASNSTIKMGGTLPAGARIVEQILAFDAMADATLEVGDSADPNRYMTDVDISSAGYQRIENIGGQDYVIGTASGDNQVVIRSTGVSAITGTIKLATFYTI